MREMITSEKVNEKYLKIDHPSGLTMLLYPMQGFSSAYAMFSTNYGSVDMAFRTDSGQDFTKIPAGTAHFLEHKMFEDEDGDAFAKYAATGASANAFTSFDKTSYLFSCADNFEESLRILLEFVSVPYFTKETVDKEQGIIGQEIKMYDDNPDWRALFNMLKGLYKNHPIAIDIAGTVQSIAEITPEILHETYRAFYNLGNMVLTVAGNFTVDQVLRVADEVLKPAEPLQVERYLPDEPAGVVQKEVSQALPVSIPIFCYGLKAPSEDVKTNAIHSIYDEILNEILVGEASPLYRKLYDEGLINATFGSEVDCGRGFYTIIFGGESKDPKRVAKEIAEEIAKLKNGGIDPAVFARCKKAIYGRYMKMLGRSDSIAHALTSSYFSGLGIYELIDEVSAATADKLIARIMTDYPTEHGCLSVITPQG